MADTTEGAGYDIAKDVRQALEVVERLQGREKREALVKLTMLTMAWIDLEETALGQTPEGAECQRKARRNLGLDAASSSADR